MKGIKKLVNGKWENIKLKQLQKSLIEKEYELTELETSINAIKFLIELETKKGKNE